MKTNMKDRLVCEGMPVLITSDLEADAAAMTAALDAMKEAYD